MDPITTGAIIGGLVEGGKALFGAGQRSRAKRALERLEKERPKGYIPSAILERANEPIAEEFIEAQEMGDQRLTSQGIGALQSGGSRAILGGLPNLVDMERQRRMQRTGQYEQARRDALGMKGAAQERIRQEERQDWQNQVAAQTAELGAGQQNIGQGLTGIGEAALFGAMGKMGKVGGADDVDVTKDATEQIDFDPNVDVSGIDDRMYIRMGGRLVLNPDYGKMILK